MVAISQLPSRLSREAEKSCKMWIEEIGADVLHNMLVSGGGPSKEELQIRAMGKGEGKEKPTGASIKEEEKNWNFD
jgi:hypothetical protein